MSNTTSPHSSAQSDEAHAPRCESPDSREITVPTREAATEERENALSAREAAAALREEAVRAREETAQARTERDVLMDRLREANEHLVLANLRAQRLADDAAHFAAIIKSTDDAVFGKSLNGVITSWNDGAQRIYGYTPEEVIGSPVTILVPPDHPDEVPRILERLKRGETIERLETERVRKDGTRIAVALTISSVRDEEGRIVGASTIARDITQSKRAERERAELLRDAQTARAEADKANHLKDEFLAMVSHELRTPLNAVLGYARMIRSHQPEGPRVAHALEAIERNAAALATIIDDLLDVSRVIAGKLKIAWDPIDLNAVARAAVDEVSLLASQKGIVVQCAADPDAIGVVQGDAERLQQVIGNLLTNAIKFTPDRGRVEVIVARGDTDVTVQVSDTGEGIDPAFLPHVFEQFRQADASAARRQGGLGLGLALVSQLVELHGGTVQASSEGKGRGATFTVRLPMTTGDTAQRWTPAAATRLSVTPLAQTAERLDGVRVLVVDDNLDGRSLTALVLSQRGATVNAVASAHEALRALQVEAPDVLVTDIGLPDEDGYTLLRQLRQQQAGHAALTPAIALTGYGGDEHRHRVLAAGFQAHIVKPFEPEELIRAVVSVAGARP